MKNPMKAFTIIIIATVMTLAAAISVTAYSYDYSGRNNIGGYDQMIRQEYVAYNFEGHYQYDYIAPPRGIFADIT